ncbi:MAG: hypothetical protein WD532_00305 [Acidimicrobiia bacterium]
MDIQVQIRVVIADPVSAMRRSLSKIVESAWGWTVVAEARDGFEAVRLSRTESADVLIADSSIGGLPTKEIRALLSATPTMVMVLIDNPDQHARQAGPSALKSVPADVLRDLILTQLHAHWAARSVVPELVP